MMLDPLYTLKYNLPGDGIQKNEALTEVSVSAF